MNHNWFPFWETNCNDEFYPPNYWYVIVKNKFGVHGSGTLNSGLEKKILLFLHDKEKPHPAGIALSVCLFSTHHIQSTLHQPITTFIRSLQKTFMGVGENKLCNKNQLQNLRNCTHKVSKSWLINGGKVVVNNGEYRTG